MNSGWVTIDIKVRKGETNEADPWELPTPSEVAAEIRERMEGLDLDTGWFIEKVSATSGPWQTGSVT